MRVMDFLLQGPEEEEEVEAGGAERYSDEDAPAAASVSGPPTEDTPAKEEGEEREVVVEEVEAKEEEGEQNVKESKGEEKGDLAGERQSGDGQVRDHELIWQHRVCVCVRNKQKRPTSNTNHFPQQTTQTVPSTNDFVPPPYPI